MPEVSLPERDWLIQNCGLQQVPMQEVVPFEKKSEKYQLQKYQTVHAGKLLPSTFQCLQNCLHQLISLVCQALKHLKILEEAACHR